MKCKVWKKKDKKCLINIVILFSIIAILLVSPISVNASTLNSRNIVTVSQKKSIKKLINHLSTPALYMLEYGKIKRGQTKVYHFSDASTRREIIKYMYSGEYNPAEQSKRIFGQRISGKKYLMGDWGCEWPVYKNMKIYKGSKNIYKVKVSACMQSDTGKIYHCGKIVFDVMKKRESAYGFIVKKMTITAK